MTNVMPVVLYLEYYDKTEFSNLAAFFLTYATTVSWIVVAQIWW